MEQLGLSEAVKELHGEGRAKSRKRYRAVQTQPQRRGRSSRFASESCPSEDSPSDESPELSKNSEAGSYSSERSHSRSEPQESEGEASQNLQHGPLRSRIEKVFEKVVVEIEADLKRYQGEDFWKIVKTQEQRKRSNLNEPRLLFLRNRQKPEPSKVNLT
jgi:hypothetical protein